MPHLSGKGVLDMKQDDSKVIMITSHADFAVDSYNYDDVVDYLLKPISFDRFYKSLEKYQRSIQPKSGQSAKQSILVKDGTKWIPIQIKDLYYIKSDSNYVTLHTTDKKIVSLMNLKDLEKELPSNFIRTHRSYIINFDFIEYFSTDHIYIKGIEIPISKKYSAQLKSMIN
jgi:DNA-binding LytR/AlgR family response regulator